MAESREKVLDIWARQSLQRIKAQRSVFSNAWPSELDNRMSASDSTFIGISSENSPDQRRHYTWLSPPLVLFPVFLELYVRVSDNALVFRSSILTYHRGFGIPLQ